MAWRGVVVAMCEARGALSAFLINRRSIARRTFTVEFTYDPPAAAEVAQGGGTGGSGSSPPAPAVTAASLVTPCATTHSVGWNQRVVFLKVRLGFSAIGIEKCSEVDSRRRGWEQAGVQLRQEGIGRFGRTGERAPGGGRGWLGN